MINYCIAQSIWNAACESQLNSKFNILLQWAWCYYLIKICLFPRFDRILVNAKETSACFY
jgi:hypothetical protein